MSNADGSAKDLHGHIHGGLYLQMGVLIEGLADSSVEVPHIQALLPKRCSPDSELATVGSEPQRSAHPSCSWFN